MAKVGVTLSDGMMLLIDDVDTLFLEGSADYGTTCVGEFTGMVELVRCKHCKHGEPGACGDGVDCDGVWHNDDWFCADGERKE